MKRWRSKHIDIRSKYRFTYILFRDMIEPNLNTDIISRFLSNMDARPLPVQPWRVLCIDASMILMKVCHLCWTLISAEHLTLMRRHGSTITLQVADCPFWNSLVAPALMMWLTGFGIPAPVHDWPLMGDVVQSVQLQGRGGEMRRPSWVIQNE